MSDTQASPGSRHEDDDHMANDPTTARPFGLDDATRLRFVSGAGFVPNGSRCFYGVVAVDVERRRDVSSLWLLDRDGDRRTEVAGPGADPRDAAASPDGTRLAFVADVDGLAQICALTVASGAVDVLTGLPQGVTGGLAWSPDGRRIAFTAPPRPRRDPSEPYRVTRATLRVEGYGMVDDALQDVHVLELGSGEVRRLTDADAILAAPRWSPAGDRILCLESCPPDREWHVMPSVLAFDVASGERRELVGAWGGVTGAEWLPDGTGIVFAGVRHESGGLQPKLFWTKHDVWTLELDGGEPVCRTAGLKTGVGTWLDIDQPTQTFFDPTLRLGSAGDVVYATAQCGCDVQVLRIALVGEERVERVVAPAGSACFLHDVGGDGDELLYVASTLTDPPELFLHADGEERRLTQLNDAAMAGPIPPRVTELEVVAPDGLRLEGRALTPPGDGPFPTVLCIHGGPSDAYGSPFMTDWQLLVGAGIAVVFSNFRGTGGYGTDHNQALASEWGARGEPDHLATIDHAIELGIADPDRLGLYGLSHGAFATCWLAGRTDRFRAGVAENPAVDFASFFYSCDLPFIVPALIGGTPEETPQAYADRSPLTYVDQCRTALLFVVSERDERTVPLESERYFRALKATGCPTEMLRLPNADHLGSWTGPVPVRMAQNEALVEWFTRWLVDA